MELCNRSSTFLGPFRPRNAGSAHAQAQSVQLAEWWADFDERYMRPVFSRPEYSADWASPNGEQGKLVLNKNYMCDFLHALEVATPCTGDLQARV